MVVPESVVKPVPAPQVIQSSSRESSRGRCMVNSFPLGLGSLLVVPKAVFGLSGLSEISSILIAWSYSFLNSNPPQPWLQVC